MSDIATRYSTETLTEKAGGTGGLARAAGYLLDLDTPERRARADNEGWTLMNIRSGRYADMVWDAIQTLKHQIADNREADEMYGERIARQDRERQQAAHRIAASNH